nr:hypothetical protein [Tanacetum cinerariifolium]
MVRTLRQNPTLEPSPEPNLDIATTIAQQLPNIIPQIVTQVTANVKKVNGGNGNARGREAAISVSWNDFKALLVEEFCPSNKMEKLENEFCNHTMPATIQRVILMAGILTNEAVRCTTLTKGSDKRKEMEESSKQGSIWKDNKKSKTGSGFVAIVPPRNDNDPKVMTCTFSLNNQFATVLFDFGADFSFISSKFVPLLNVEPCIVNPDLIPLGHRSFDVIVRMDSLSKNKTELKILVYCNASNQGLGCVLIQRGKVIAYASRQLKIHKKNYATYDLELGAVVFSPRLGGITCECVADALSRKERVKPRRVRAMIMTIQSGVKEMTLAAQSDVRMVILNKAYKSRYSVHPGADKMYHDLRDLYWWSGNEERYCYLQWKWDKITRDLITKLPRSRSGHEAIWVIVDRLTKSAHFLAIREDFSTKKLARLYIDVIVARHRVPMSIISDQDG